MDTHSVVLLITLVMSSVHVIRGNRRHERTDSDHGAISAEKRLIQSLLTRYKTVGKAGRPVRNSTYTLTVQFGLGLTQMDLNEKKKMLTLSMWTRYVWTDEYLRWNPEDYDGVTQLTIDPTDIWIPDIMLINAADIEAPARSTMAVVLSDGVINWYPHCIYHSTCSVNVSNFPFDRQKCNLAFGSWTHPTSELNIEMLLPEGLDLSTYHTENRDSSEWNLYDVTARRRIMPSETEYPNYSVLTFELYLSRKLVFSTYILTLPCVFLAFLTLVVFWLPPERPDRTALAMSTFSTFMFLLLILVESSPTANTIPLLGVYYCINMVIIVMTVVLSTLVINLSRGPKDRKSRPPAWLRAVALKGLARLFYMPSIYKELSRHPPSFKPPGSLPEDRSFYNSWQDTGGAAANGVDNMTKSKICPRQNDSHQQHEDEATEILTSPTRDLTSPKSDTSPPRDMTSLSRDTRSPPRDMTSSSTRDITSTIPTVSALRAMVSELELTRKSMESLESRITKHGDVGMPMPHHDHHDMNRVTHCDNSNIETRDVSSASSSNVAVVLWEWQSVAVVMDRFFFALYIIIIVLSLIFFFPRPDLNYPMVG